MMSVLRRTTTPSPPTTPWCAPPRDDRRPMSYFALSRSRSAQVELLHYHRARAGEHPARQALVFDNILWHRMIRAPRQSSYCADRYRLRSRFQGTVDRSKVVVHRVGWVDMRIRGRFPDVDHPAHPAAGGLLNEVEQQ